MFRCKLAHLTSRSWDGLVCELIFSVVMPCKENHHTCILRFLLMSKQINGLRSDFWTSPMFANLHTFYLIFLEEICNWNLKFGRIVQIRLHYLAYYFHTVPFVFWINALDRHKINEWSFSFVEVCGNVKLNCVIKISITWDVYLIQNCEIEVLHWIACE